MSRIYGRVLLCPNISKDNHTMHEWNHILLFPSALSSRLKDTTYDYLSNNPYSNNGVKSFIDLVQSNYVGYKYFMQNYEENWTNYVMIF